MPAIQPKRAGRITIQIPKRTTITPIIIPAMFISSPYFLNKLIIPAIIRLIKRQTARTKSTPTITVTTPQNITNPYFPIHDTLTVSGIFLYQGQTLYYQ